MIGELKGGERAGINFNQAVQGRAERRQESKDRGSESGKYLRKEHSR